MAAVLQERAHMEQFIRHGWNAENIPNYDCMNSTRRHGQTNYFIGVVFLAYGVSAEILYSLALMIMTRKEHRRLSCYKIMIALGVYDMAAIAVNSLTTGYLWLIGANYCTNPNFIFVSGAMGLGLWCGACLHCFVLVINRVLEVSNKLWLNKLFRENRTYFVLLLPITYSLYFTFFTPPVLFNSDHMAWFFFTFAPGHDADMYYNFPHTANNLFVVAATCILYIPYSHVLLRNSKFGHGLSWAQKSFFIQCTLICTANLVAALIYVYMQFFITPSYFVLIGHICWQLGHGFPAIVYLLLNRTIQREIMILLKLRKPLGFNQVNPVHSKTHISD